MRFSALGVRSAVTRQGKGRLERRGRKKKLDGQANAMLSLSLSLDLFFSFSHPFFSTSTS